MQDSPVTIGAISLQDFEIPQSVRFGGRHRLTVHSLASGRRVIERLGPDDNEIQFQGTFSGPNAEVRVRAFDSLRLSGETVWLTWESFRRQVIVKSFVAIYNSPWWIPYKVSCTVVSQSHVNHSQGMNTAGLLSSDLSYALSAAAGSTTSLASLATALTATNASTAGTSDQTEAVAAATSVLTALGSQVSQQSAELAVPINPGNGSDRTVSLFASRVNTAGGLAAAIIVRSYVGRIAVNLVGTVG